MLARDKKKIADKERKKKAIANRDLYREYSDVKDPLMLTLPIPISVNSMYIHTRRGGLTLSRDAKLFERNAKALMLAHIEDQEWSALGKDVWVYLDMVFFFPDRITRDASNCLKLLLDVMQGIIYQNDYNALPRIQSVEYDKDNPRLEIVVTPQCENTRNSILSNVKPQPV